jgi:hypothetical protein
MNNSSNSKSNSLFIVICIILIVVFLILFLYVKGVNQDLKLKYEKNVFFLELDKKPYHPFNAYTNEDQICVKGENQSSRSISNNDLKIRQNNPEFLLMFWFKINSNNVINDRKKPNSSYFDKPSNHDDLPDNGDTEKNLMLKLDNRYKIKLNTRNASIHFVMNDNESILSNIPYDKWICLATFYTNDYTEIYLNGRLAETLQYTNSENSEFNNSLNASKLEIGHFPGHLAYLVVSVKDKYFNSYSIYQEYLYYKNRVTRSDKHKNNIDFNFKLNLGLLDNNYNPNDLYKNDRSNICNN